VFWLAAVEHDRRRLLRRGSGGGSASAWEPKIFNTTGRAIHQRRVHRQTRSRGNRDFDGRARRFMAQHFIERLWRSIKYEEIHRRPTPTAARRAPISSWMTFTISAPHQRWTIRCRWRSGKRVSTRSRRRRRLWICRFAWTTQTRCPHTHSKKQKQQEAA